MAVREVAEVADLPRGEPVADPFPVQRDPVTGLQIADHADAVDGAHHSLGFWFSNAEQVTVPGERAGFDDDLIAGYGAYLAPADPAPIEHCQRVLGLAAVAQQAGPGVDAEHRETVMGHAPGKHAGGEGGELAAGNAAEPLFHRVAHGARGDLIEPRTAHPVGLDDPRVKRVLDTGGRGDQLQVRPGPGKLLRQCPQPAIVNSSDTVLEEGGRIVRSAVAMRVGRECVTGEEHRPGNGHGAGLPISSRPASASLASASSMRSRANPMWIKTQSPGFSAS